MNEARFDGDNRISLPMSLFVPMAECYFGSGPRRTPDPEMEPGDPSPEPPASGSEEGTFSPNSVQMASPRTMIPQGFAARRANMGKSPPPVEGPKENA